MLELLEHSPGLVILLMLCGLCLLAFAPAADKPFKISHVQSLYLRLDRLSQEADCLIGEIAALKQRHPEFRSHPLLDGIVGTCLVIHKDVAIELKRKEPRELMFNELIHRLENVKRSLLLFEQTLSN